MDACAGVNSPVLHSVGIHRQTLVSLNLGSGVTATVTVAGDPFRAARGGLTQTARRHAMWLSGGGRWSTRGAAECTRQNSVLETGTMSATDPSVAAEFVDWMEPEPHGSLAGLIAYRAASTSQSVPLTRLAHPSRLEQRTSDAQLHLISNTPHASHKQPVYIDSQNDICSVFHYLSESGSCIQPQRSSAGSPIPSQTPSYMPAK